jgi:UDP-N-acetylmuramyl pentapeptide phosphotransferase/UDP-N-acetylglucosamine-1-phosphate transferase
MTGLRRLLRVFTPHLVGVLAGLLTRTAWRILRARPPGGEHRWRRVNHRGESVTLLEGPALVAGTAAAVAFAPGLTPGQRMAGLTAVTGAGSLGAVDDLVGDGEQKGLRGHLGQLAQGRVTTGGLKVVGIGGTALLAAACALPRQPGQRRTGRVIDVVTAGALVAGTANMVNLLDLRPGRALKSVLLAAPVAGAQGGGAVLAAAVSGAAGALLPQDLAEETMLGDTGANAAGAVLGTAVVAGTGRRMRMLALAGVIAATLASERWSFTQVIESTPGLRELDAFGRRES